MAPWSSYFYAKTTTFISRLLVVICAVFFILLYVAFHVPSTPTSGYSRTEIPHIAPARVSPDISISGEEICLQNFASVCEPRDLLKPPKYHPLGEKSSGCSDYFIKTHKTTSCPRNLREVSSSYPRTWLLSLPGSGNTWMRHLLQQLTGHPTGSVYNDSALLRKGFPYESQVNGVVAIKIHSLLHIYSRKNIIADTKTDRLIFLLRNPFSSLIADYKRGRMQLRHTGNGFVNSSQEEWNAFIEKRVPKWGRTVLKGLQSELEKVIVFYEDLKSQPLTELIRLATFLKRDNLKEFSFCCTLYRSEGRFHRPPSNQTVEEVFTEPNKKLINSMLSELAGVVQQEHPKVARKLLTFILPEK